MTNARLDLHGGGLTDVRMMVVAHSSFRRELTLSVPAVRRTPAGDFRRAGEVAEHVAVFLDAVLHHHTIEDDLLWEPLAARVPLELAPLVELMQEQHHDVHARLIAANGLVQVWRASASTLDRETLADSLHDLVTALCEHLDTEETHVLPLMARHITAPEWEEFTRQGMESIPRRLMLVGLGMMLYEGDPDAIALEVRKLPAPVRPFLPVLGRFAYRRYARRLHGTPTPSRVSG
jgi:hemerythrin-like domain-containing protein